MIFDSHAHLDDRRFDKDRDEVIKRAKENGISYIMNPGADFESSVKAVELANKYDMIYAAVGVHPHDAKTMDDMLLQLLKSLTKKPKVMAIGEIGLDFHYDHSPRDVQKKWFREQIRLAKEVNLPIIIHDREANNDVMNILKEEKAFDTGVLMHCYSGSAELAKQYIRNGAYISIAGPITFKNARKTVEVVETISIDHLMIETDSPYLTPHPHRGERNESSYVRYVAEKIAEIKGISVEEVAKRTTENAKRYFRIK
ncbi:TatD family hydrolase [Paramaledivibacter caminithermalis]|uniref:TatD DNase family protein n=1 Tax=Paramaledivibacter caminithermalis (strain DSM 15212 / CIP 107654 / DViRD3) TaxID=1121301 RepID=A0A1M6TTU5_PARC5|nr:TatD family hydrolase [Paramaledivibacter caminithermalis]SHK60422.1 TatD DNase family protein [Paramaledivibacter caminithermalis DSM 15212]